jgi:hypothetical protein
MKSTLHIKPKKRIVKSPEEYEQHLLATQILIQQKKAVTQPVAFFQDQSSFTHYLQSSHSSNQLGFLKLISYAESHQEGVESRTAPNTNS